MCTTSRKTININTSYFPFTCCRHIEIVCQRLFQTCREILLIIYNKPRACHVTVWHRQALVHGLFICCFLLLRSNNASILCIIFLPYDCVKFCCIHYSEISLQPQLVPHRKHVPCLNVSSASSLTSQGIWSVLCSVYRALWHNNTMQTNKMHLC